MNRWCVTGCLIGCLISAAFAFVPATEAAQESATVVKRADFVSNASFIVGTYAPASLAHTPGAMANAAIAFLDSLDAQQRDDCADDLKSDLRREWTNLPPRRNADGVRLGDLSAEQCRLACDLMATVFSEQGYNKMRDIMLADDQLLKGGRARPGFGTEEFAIVIFGTPSPTEPWAFQLDGHHVGANVSIHGDEMTLSPSFIGTQPQTFQIGGKTFRPFKNETDLAHELAMSLNDDQVQEAILSSERARISTGPGRDGHVPNLGGVSCGGFSAVQKETLLALISQWVGDLPKPQASKRMQQIATEIDQMKFGWNGNREPGNDVSYSIQSPSLIIEYACQNLGGVPTNHLHSNYRDPTNEYGGQLDQ